MTTTTPLDLPALPVGASVQHPLLVVEVDQRGGDRPHTILTLGNSTGRLQSAPFWPEKQHLVAGIGRGAVVQVIARVSEYKGSRQLEVTSIRPLPRGTVDPRTLLPSVGNVEGYWQRLDAWRAGIRLPRLAATLALFYDDPEFRAAYESCPASTAGHHAQLGGLLKHTWEIAYIGRAMATAMRADPDLVLAGALLHDIGKLQAYRWEPLFETTDEGALLGHVVLGSLMLERRARAATPLPCTEDELALLHHFILSHHGELEYGAAVRPMTLEAEILHFADNTSAKAASLTDALGADDLFAEGARISARGVWQLDRRKVARWTSDWGAQNEAATQPRD